MNDRSSLSVPMLAPAAISTETLTSRHGTRKKASTACTACRTRRSKCTGGTPCLSCISHHTECFKDENEDGRRRIAIKRKLEGLEDDRGLLDGLVMILKHGNELQIQSLVSLIRTSTSRNDLRTFLDTTLEDRVTFYSQSLGVLHAGDHSPEALASPGRPRTGGIADLMNPPIQVPAKPWTGVISDNDYVSHLISLWFTWAHPCFRWVEIESFIAAMQSQDLRSPLCSPYLVNSILAQACLLDAPYMQRNSYHNLLRERFMAEAKTGIEAEQGRASLTLIQAMGIQWTSLYLNGEDQVGRIQLNTQLFLAKNLDRWQEGIKREFKDNFRILEQVDSALNYLEWVHFGLNAFDLTNYQCLHRILTPTRRMPALTHDQASDLVWPSYPLHRNMPMNFHPDCYFRSQLSLAELVAENEDLSTKRNSGESNETHHVQNLLKKIEAWPSSLPSCMSVHAQAIPHVFVLHALHHWSILVLAKQAASAEAGHPTDPVLTFTPASPGQTDWQQLSIRNAVAVAEVLHNYTRYWTTDYFPPMIMQPIALSLLALLEDVETEKNKEAFMFLSKTLLTISRKLRVGRGVMRVVRDTAKSKDVVLPVEAEVLFEMDPSPEAESLSDRSNSHAERLGLGKERDITVNYLLEKWDDLELDLDMD